MVGPGWADGSWLAKIMIRADIAKSPCPSPQDGSGAVGVEFLVCGYEGGTPRYWSLRRGSPPSACGRLLDVARRSW